MTSIPSQMSAGITQRSEFVRHGLPQEISDRCPSALTSCSFQFMFGKLYALFSTKKIFISAVIIFEAGSLISGLAPTSLILVLGRAISGLGASGVVAGVFTMVSLSVPLRQRAAFSGFGAAIECCAFAIAPLVGGILTDRLSWRWCFFINLPLGAVTIITTALFFQDPQRALQAPLTFVQKLAKLDALSTLVFVPSITFLLIALQWGGSRYGWDDVRIIALLVTSASLVALFAWLQRRGKENSLLPSRIIGQRSIYCGMLFVFCINTTLAIVQYYVSGLHLNMLRLSIKLIHYRCPYIFRLSDPSRRPSRAFLSCPLSLVSSSPSSFLARRYLWSDTMLHSLCLPLS